MPSPVAPVRPGRGHIYLIHIKNGDILMNNLSTRLKELRKLNNVTQKQLAEFIGASERGVQNYEQGSRKPAYDMLIAIADYFDVSIDYLVGRTGNPKINK